MIKTYFPNLDALRTLSFLSVFFYHSFHTEHEHIQTSGPYRSAIWIFRNGDLGVHFFFVLSGFLITYLLLEEGEKSGRISLGKFYVRRILRIWPLYFFTVFFGFVIFPLLKSFMGQQPAETAQLGLFLAFLSNFNNIWNGMPDASMLGVLWSVSVEEQFYLIWPVLLIIVPGKYYRLTFFGLLIPLWFFRYMHVDSGEVLFFHSLSVAPGLVIGALGATYAKKDHAERIVTFLRMMNWPVIYILTVVVALFRQEIFLGDLLISVEILVIDGLFLLIILDQVYNDHSQLKFGKSRYLDSWGKYTYGLYCLHFIGILIATNTNNLLGLNENIWGVILLDTALALGISHVIAWFSYYGMERYFLKLKNRKFTPLEEANKE